MGRGLVRSASGDASSEPGTRGPLKGVGLPCRCPTPCVGPANLPCPAGLRRPTCFRAIGRTLRTRSQRRLRPSRRPKLGSDPGYPGSEDGFVWQKGLF